MLSTASIESIKALGLDPEVLEQAFKSDVETDVIIPTGSFFTEETLIARDTNKLTEGKRLGIDEGRQAGFEIVNKMLIEKAGLKDIDKKEQPIKVIEAMVNVLSKGDEGMQGQIKALQSDKLGLETQIQTIQSEKKVFERNTTLLSLLPKNRTSVLSDSEYLNIINSNIEEVDGKLAVKVNGEIIRHPQTRDIVELNEGINQLFSSREGWLQKATGTGGRGGDDNHGAGSGIRTYSQAEAAYEKANGEGSALGIKFNAYIADLAKNKDFDINK